MKQRIPSLDEFINEAYYLEDKIRLNIPCTVFVKSKKHLRDIVIDKEDKETIEWHKNGNDKKVGTFKKTDIVDISYQDE